MALWSGAVFFFPFLAPGTERGVQSASKQTSGETLALTFMRERERERERERGVCYTDIPYFSDGEKPRR